MAKFGKEIRDQFALDPEGVFLNHGSYGCAPKTVLQAKLKMVEQVEFHPDTYYRRYLENAWHENLQVVCDFLELKKENTTLVENATSGMNSIIKSVKLVEGDIIAVHTWTYKAVLMACHSAADKVGAKVLPVPLTLPIASKEQVIEAYDKFFKENPRVKLAIVDYISSVPAIVFPVKEIADVCHKYDVLCAVDGAHAPGQVPLGGTGADFMAGNLHKWCYAAKGSALLWIDDKHLKMIEPERTAHCYKETLHKNFFTQATRDSTSYMVIKDAVDFYKEIGGMDAVTSYTKPLLDRAVEHLTKLWGTKTLPIPRDMEPPNLRMIELPKIKSYPKEAENVPEDKFGDYDKLQNAVFREHNLQFLAIIVHNVPYVRLSANVYNTMEDYERLGQIILDLAK